MTQILHLCLGVVKECKNPDSYGHICVRCNQCGRFDKAQQVEPEAGYESPKAEAESAAKDARIAELEAELAKGFTLHTALLDYTLDCLGGAPSKREKQLEARIAELEKVAAMQHKVLWAIEFSESDDILLGHCPLCDGDGDHNYQCPLQAVMMAYEAAKEASEG